MVQFESDNKQHFFGKFFDTTSRDFVDLKCLTVYRRNRLLRYVKQFLKSVCNSSNTLRKTFAAEAAKELATL